MKRRKQWRAASFWQGAEACRQRTARGKSRPALPLLLGGLALLCAFGLAGCGAKQPEAPGQPAKTAERTAAHRPAPLPLTQNAGEKTLTGARPAVWSQLPWHIRAARADHTLYIDIPEKIPLHELGIFDLTGDGVPELMAFNYGMWLGSCTFYDLAGQGPVRLGGTEWMPDGPERVWSKPMESGTAWRFDFQGSHSTRLIWFSNMLFPAENGLHYVTCWENIETADMTDWEPVEWNYTVAHYLIRDGVWQRDVGREYERLTFLPDERLAELAGEDPSQSGGGIPGEAGEDPEEAARILPASEREEVLEGSLYRQLLNDGWAETEVPWLLERDLEPADWTSLDFAERCRRLYEAWETRQVG